MRAYARGEQPPYGFPKALEVIDGGSGPVSAADLAVNTWLIKGLQSAFSSVDWSVISEETSKNELKDILSAKSDWVWILDPLDGTKDFLQGTGEYAVHLALVKNQTPVLGVILIPELEELWLGIVGLEAWCENRQANRSSVQLSKRSQLDQMVLVASRNHRDQRLEKLLSTLSLGETKAIGSVGCKIAAILRGEADIYISLSGESAPKDWDMAAPEAVLIASGGCFTHANKQRLIYKKGDFLQSGCIIASNGNNHSELCDKSLKVMSEIDPGFLV